MKRTALFFITVCLTALVCAAASSARAGEESCSRKNLVKITDKYFESIQKHRLSDLPLASTVKFTENGAEKEVGKGFWETAGNPLLKRTLVDTKKRSKRQIDFEFQRTVLGINSPTPEIIFS